MTNAHAVALGRLGGLRGGPARAAVLTSEERSAIALSGARARWRSAREKTTTDLDMRDRSHRKVKAHELVARFGGDVDLVEQVLYMQTMPPWLKLVRGLGRSRLGTRGPSC